MSNVPEDCWELLEEKSVEAAQEPGVVGVDADEQTDACADHEVDDQHQGDDLHMRLDLIIKQQHINQSLLLAEPLQELIIVQVLQVLGNHSYVSYSCLQYRAFNFLLSHYLFKLLHCYCLVNRVCQIIKFLPKFLSFGEVIYNQI